MLKVLVVEDEPYVRRGIVLSVDWTALDCFVVGEAANGEEGYDAALKFQPNIIITDIRMPKMDGTLSTPKTRCITARRTTFSSPSTMANWSR